MSYRYEKNESGGQDLVIDGFESGIASSPHNGIAHIQSGNISTENGEVLASFARVSQLAGGVQTNVTLTPTSNSTVSFSPSIPAGTWFTVTADSGTGLSGSYYYKGDGKISTTYTTDPAVYVNNIITGPVTTIFLTSGTTWTVPSDWNNAYNSIECIGGGGGSGSCSAVSDPRGGGGGGGAYAKKTNLTLTPGALISYSIGSAGTAGTGNGDGGDGGDTTFNTSSVIAKGGKKGLGHTNGGTGGAGGLASGSTGDTKYNGGTGADQSGGVSGSGGGAAGLHGAGNNGAASAAGGSGDAGFGGAGGAINNPGVKGTEYDSTHGSGGGGGSGVLGDVDVHGGLYGAGAGGATQGTASAGAQGLIVIQYIPATPITTSATVTSYSMGEPYQSATEPYFDTSAVQQYRYYILDKNGLIWVHDTAITSPVWFNPDFSTYGLNYSGLAVLNGWLAVCVGSNGSPGTANAVIFKSTSLLASTFTSSGLGFQLGTTSNHFSYISRKGKMFVTDGNFINTIIPNTGGILGVNLQSYGSYTASTTTATLSALINGSLPVIRTTSARIPVVFFTGGTLPSAITANTIYYIKWLNSGLTFEVYSASSGGSALDMQTGAVGTQYFNTFYPVGSAGASLQTLVPQQLNLPADETSTCVLELGNTLLIGCKSNNIYVWDQMSISPGGFIPLPENDIVNMINVKNTAYVFAGHKGNIYITTGSAVSTALSVPDYCAGIAGTASSYIEPYFSWGGAMFIRGRIYFSILDQTSTKAGNCGGIWSFIPDTQNTCLRLENQSSYGTYNGVCPVLLASQVQTVIGPQYWSAWYSSITSPSYGIDFSDTVPSASVVIETDLVPTGTTLQQKTFTQIEYKLATPLVTGESVALYQRPDGNSSFTTLGAATVESATSLSGYFPVNFQKGQWVQFRVVLSPLQSSSTSFVRLKQIRLR